MIWRRSASERPGMQCDNAQFMLAARCPARPCKQSTNLSKRDFLSHKGLQVQFLDMLALFGTKESAASYNDLMLHEDSRVGGLCLCGISGRSSRNVDTLPQEHLSSFLWELH